MRNCSLGISVRFTFIPGPLIKKNDLAQNFYRLKIIWEKKSFYLHWSELQLQEKETIKVQTMIRVFLTSKHF